MTPKRWPQTVYVDEPGFLCFYFCFIQLLLRTYPEASMSKWTSWFLQPNNGTTSGSGDDGLCRHDWLYATQSRSMQHQLHLAVSSLDASATSESFSTTGTWAKIPANKCKLNWSSTLKVYRFGQSSKLHAAHSQQCEQNQQKPGDMEHLHKVSDKELAQHLQDLEKKIRIWTPLPHTSAHSTWLTSMRHPPIRSNTHSREQRVQDMRTATCNNGSHGAMVHLLERNCQGTWWQSKSPASISKFPSHKTT